MGFTVGDAALELAWPDGHRLAGLEVSMREISLVQLLDISQQQDDTVPTPSIIVDHLATYMIGWNVDDVPLTREGIESLPASMGMEIYRAWTDAIGGGMEVPADLKEKSIPGEMVLPMSPPPIGTLS